MNRRNFIKSLALVPAATVAASKVVPAENIIVNFVRGSLSRYSSYLIGEEDRWSLEFSSSDKFDPDMSKSLAIEIRNQKFILHKIGEVSYLGLDEKDGLYNYYVKGVGWEKV